MCYDGEQVFLPIQVNLNVRADEELICQKLILRCFACDSVRPNPRVLDGALKSYMAEGKRIERE